MNSKNKKTDGKKQAYDTEVKKDRGGRGANKNSWTRHKIMQSFFEGDGELGGGWGMGKSI